MKYTNHEIAIINKKKNGKKLHQCNSIDEKINRASLLIEYWNITCDEKCRNIFVDEDSYYEAVEKLEYWCGVLRGLEEAKEVLK